MINNYIINAPIDNDSKMFTIKDSKGNFLGIITVYESSVRIKGSINIEPKVLGDEKFETKVY